MESDEMQVKQMLERTKRVFDKHGGRVSISNYKKVLAAIAIVPEDDYVLGEYFNAVDLDGDGYVSYDDFKQCVLQPLMEDEDTGSHYEQQEINYEEQSLLTLEKLSEFKSMFEYHKKGKIAKIMDMREDIINSFKGFMIKLSEFDVFFKDFSEEDVVKEDQFYEIYNHYEQKILEKAAVYDNASGDMNKEIDVEMEDVETQEHEDAYQYMEEVIIGGGDESEGHEDDDHDHDDDDGEDEKDPEVALQDIVDHVVDSGSIHKMKPDQIRKLFHKIKSKVDKVNVKVQNLEKKNTQFKNQNDVFKNEKDFFQRKIKDLKEKNDSLKEAKYKLECDVEDLMKFEQDFQRMLKQNEEKDLEIIKLEDEIDEYKRQTRSLEMRLRR